MAGGDYSILEASEVLGRIMAEAAREAFTGKITITMHARRGGVVQMEAMKDWKIERQPTAEPGIGR